MLEHLIFIGEMMMLAYFMFLVITQYSLLNLENVAEYGGSCL